MFYWGARRQVAIILFVILSSRAVFGDTVGQYQPHSGMLLGVAAGPTFLSGVGAQTLNLQSNIIKTYSPDSNTYLFPSVELFLARQQLSAIRFAPYTLISQIGLSLVESGSAKLTGNIWDDADPAFNNFNYAYKVNHAHVAVKARLLGKYSFTFNPYLSASLGVGLNHAYGFTIAPKIYEAVSAPRFSSNTMTSFTYTLGIGLEKSLNKRLQVAVGYELSDWGRTSLASAPSQTTGHGIIFNHLYAHQLQMTILYLV